MASEFTCEDDLDRRVLLEALHAIVEGVAIYDAEGRHLFVNNEARRRYASFYGFLASGLSHRDALAATVRARAPHLSPERVNAIADDFFEKYQSDATYTSQTDDRRTVVTTYRPMSNGLKLGISLDITSLQAREQELIAARAAAEAASNAKTAFLANMSHEIRTPLNGILGMAQALGASSLAPDQQEQVAAIVSSGRGLLTILNDILDLSRLETGAFELAPALSSVQDLMRRLDEAWRPMGEGKGLAFHTEIDASVPNLMMFDAARVQQCVSKLISNAIRFTERGEVRVTLRPDAGKERRLFEVVVSDTGPGVTHEARERIFQPFVQGDDSFSRVHGGAGLGLSIARRIARMMGGDVRMESETGKGSAFSFTFAAQVVEARRSPSETMPAESGSGLQGVRALVVDDNPVNRKVVSLLLRRHGVETFDAGDGAAALSRLEAERFDLVLLDIHMPVMDGPETIRRIRASARPWSAIPVVAVTADAMADARGRFLAMGMDGFVAKPVAEQDLLSEAAWALSGAAKRAGAA
jgi:signal transduction histidine kinase/CheY-like chemotaxis protein